MYLRLVAKALHLDRLLSSSQLSSTITVDRSDGSSTRTGRMPLDRSGPLAPKASASSISATLRQHGYLLANLGKWDRNSHPRGPTSRPACRSQGCRFQEFQGRATVSLRRRHRITPQERISGQVGHKTACPKSVYTSARAIPPARR